MTWTTAVELASLLGTNFRPPRYADVAARTEQLITDGRIPPGNRLPSERDLATATNLSRTTITAAYARLTAAGLLRPRRGAGHFVPQRPAPTASSLLPASGPDADNQIALTVAANPAPPAVQAAYRTALDGLSDLTGGSGYFPDGLPQLRQALADRYCTRGLPTDPDQIMITSGALSALQICARTLSKPRSMLITESLGYGNSLRMLDAVAHDTRARIRTFDVSSDGWNLTSLQAALESGRASAIFCTPDYHNPTGLLMHDDQRSTMAALAHAAGVPIVADETLIELSMPWSPAAKPLACFQPEALLVGSASKAYWGGLRLGWIRGPHAIMDDLVQTRTIADHGSAVLEQLVLTELINDPAAATAARTLIRDQVSALIDLIGEHLPQFGLRRPDGGSSLWLELPAARSTELVDRAAAHRLLLTPGPHFFHNPGGERWLRLPAVAPVPTLTEAVHRLATAWHEVESGIGQRHGRHSDVHRPTMSA